MVVGKRFKFAFTVSEALISLLILLTIVISLSIVVVKFIPKKSKTIISEGAIFACFYDDCDKNNQNCKLKQILFENKTIKDDKDVTEAGKCTFDPPKYASKFYIIATGAGSKDNAGQLKSDYAFQDYSDIIPGIASSNFEDGNTKISDRIVYAGQNNTNGLQYENIEGCELLSTTSKCPGYLTTNSSAKCTDAKTNRTPTSCEVIKTDDDVPAVKILGCDCDSDVNTDINIIKLNQLKRVDEFLDRLDKNDLFKISKSQLKNIYIYSYADIASLDNTFKFNFKLKDSNYDINIKSPNRNFSKMEEILANMSPLRSNEIIKKIMSLHPGAPNQNGAVVIMW